MFSSNTLEPRQLKFLFKRFQHSVGTQETFRVLSKTLSEMMPVERIVIYCVYKNMQSIMILADSEVEPSKSTLHNFSLSRSIVKNKILFDAALFDDVTPYREDVSKDYAYRSPFYQNYSMIRLPFYQNNGITLAIDFFGKEKGVFSQEHFEYLQETIELMNNDLEEIFDYIISDTSLQDNVATDSSFDCLKICPSLNETCNIIEQIAQTNATVLIGGETGTGKEVVARAIHEKSNRCDKEMIVINCGALPETLIDSELFGYEKGAFTGANQSFKGAFERAHHSTLFLDEIGEMPLSMQARLLRAIENKRIRRVGGTSSINLDVRIIAASNVNLKQAAKEGKFRQDLFYRLNLIHIELAPLRQRKQDIKILTNFFIQKLSKEYKLPIPANNLNINWEDFLDYSWQGNVRELKALIEKHILLKKDIVSLDLNAEDELKNLNFELEADCNYSLEILEKKYIHHVLKKTNFKLSGKNSASEILGIHYTTLKAKMEKFNITI